MVIRTKVPNIGTKVDLSEMDNIVSYNIIKDRKKNIYEGFSRKMISHNHYMRLFVFIERIDI